MSGWIHPPLRLYTYYTHTKQNSTHILSCRVIFALSDDSQTQPRAIGKSSLHKWNTKFALALQVCTVQTCTCSILHLSCLILSCGHILFIKTWMLEIPLYVHNSPFAQNALCPVCTVCRPATVLFLVLLFYICSVFTLVFTVLVFCFFFILSYILFYFILI